MRIPPELANKVDGSQFLLYDSGPGTSERVTIFASARMLSALRSSKHWLADGTFRVSPQLFYQVYSIHCKVNGSVIPAAYVLMTHKSAAAYVQALTVLKNECGPEGQPETVIVDFEQAAISAFHSVFPDVVVRGCFFHLSQCIYRKVQGIGLQELYSADPDVALKVRMIAALALVPEDDVPLAFDALSEVIPSEILPVLDYFEDNFVGRRTAQNRRRPRFPPALWNHYESAMACDPKTTNSVEAWHRGFQSHVQCSHPTIWKFIEVLHREDAMNLHRLELIDMGQQERRPKRYQDAAQRLQTLATSYDSTQLLRYLTGVAYNVTI